LNFSNMEFSLGNYGVSGRPQSPVIELHRQPGARSWLEDYYDDWKALRAGSPGESP